MAYDTNRTVVDAVDDNLAQYFNEQGTAIQHVMSSVPFANYGSITSSSGTITLTDNDYPSQFISPGTANVTVVLPTAGTANHPFYLFNVGTSAFGILPKYGGTLIGGTINAAGMNGFASNGTATSTYGWYTFSGTATGSSSGGGGNEIVDGRLTLGSGTAITTADITGATTIYFTPYKGNKIALYDGASAWNVISFTEKSLALGTITSGLPYDVFGYNNGGTLALEMLAWTNGTTRATALTTQDGVLVKTGNTTRRYLGTFYTTSTTQTEDSASKRFLWNYYNRVRKFAYCVDTTDSWAYTTATWRAANNNTTTGVGRIECITGWAEDFVEAIVHAPAFNTSGTSPLFSPGVGIDSTSANSAQIMGSGAATTGTGSHDCFYMGMLAVGYHYIQRLEISKADGATNWLGDYALSYIQSGMVVNLAC